MNAVSDIITRPLLPIELILFLAVLAFGLALYGLWRRLRGAWLRMGAVLALMLALLDPALLSEDRVDQPDIVAIVVDESGSQTIEDRLATAEAAAASIEAELRRLSEAGGGVAPIDVRVVRVPGDDAAGTRLVGGLADALAEISPDQLAGAILITDGVVADGELGVPGLSLGGEAGDEDGASPPVHVLLTGRADEYDRRLVVETAPAYGVVGETVTITFRIDEELGAEAVRPTADDRVFVEVLVDGVSAATGYARIGRPASLRFALEHAGHTVVELRAQPDPAEITDRNNVAAFVVNGVRERLRVLLVSGEPHAGERTWRNLLKADPSVDLVHFTILRPPNKQSFATVNELALIPFPTHELFEEKLDEFDLIIFDRYRRWGILDIRYIRNIAEYVRQGGAVLVSMGPAFAGVDSMYRTPLRDVLPAAPTNDVVETAFRPEVTELGARHPVTRSLPTPAAADAAPGRWGRWLRLIEVTPISGDIVMHGADRPLLILDRVGQGRVAMLASDHVWLWARGYEGGGPHAELLRRLAHWLMREPELEEEALSAAPLAGGFRIERRSLAPGPKSVVVVGPDGAERSVELSPVGDGLWAATVRSDTLGLHRVTDAPDSVITYTAPGSAAEPQSPSFGAPSPSARAPLSTVTVVGPPSPAEFANPVSTPAHLTDLAERTGGAVVRLAEAETPELRRIREGRLAAGEADAAPWLGLVRREAYEVQGVSLSAIAPAWLFFLVAGFFVVAAWRVEGR